MYIQKEIITEYGIPATYHVLHAVHSYYDMGVSHIDIAGHFSKESFNGGANAIVVHQISVEKTSFENEKDIYNAVLNSIVFKDGVLCED